MTAPHLHVDVHPGSGPHVLLVHGVLASRAAWLPNLEALSAVATPVVAELWGHGRSPAPEDPSAYRADAYLTEFERIRAGVGADRWFVCGLSLGAALTIRYTLDHPDRVLGQVFTNSTSALADRAWLDQVEAAIAADADRIEAEGHAAIVRHPLHPSRGKRLHAGARQALEADAARHDPRGVAATFRHTVPTAPVRDRLRENTRPALLVVGERERSFAAGRAYAEASMPHLEVVAADAGHAVNLEQPDVFNEAVAGFVRANSA